MNADDGQIVIGAIPAITLKQFKRKVSSTLFFMKTSIKHRKKTLVGMACLSKKDRKHVLHDVYVKPLCRRHGTGKALVNAALKFAKKNKLHLSLNVNPLNNIAINLYSSLGFKICKEQTIAMEQSFA